jgi:hypothetical protein
VTDLKRLGITLSMDEVRLRLAQLIGVEFGYDALLREAAS